MSKLYSNNEVDTSESTEQVNCNVHVLNPDSKYDYGCNQCSSREFDIIKIDYDKSNDEICMYAKCRECGHKYVGGFQLGWLINYYPNQEAEQ